MTKNLILLFTCFLLPALVYAQTDEDLVRHTLNNYLNGTSFNQVEQIRSAFHPESELFLENKDESLNIMTNAEYIALFGKREAGKFNGRYGKILAIDIEGNLALAKAEILIPAINRRYLDVFILKRMPEGKWLIVSKAANSKPIQEE